MAKKSVQAWAVLFGDELVSWSNGAEFQYPIFYSQHEAKAWKLRHRNTRDDGQVVRVEVREIRHD